MKRGFRKGSVCFSETLVFISQTAWRHIPEDLPMLLMSSEVWVCLSHMTEINLWIYRAKIIYKYLITNTATLETRGYYVERPENFTST